MFQLLQSQSNTSATFAIEFDAVMSENEAKYPEKQHSKCND